MRLLMAAAVGAWACCGAAHGDHAAQVDALVKPLIESNVLVGCVVGVVDHGKIEVHSFGEVSRGGGKTPDGRTVYEIGSVTKAFTGLVLADMVRRGEVTLDTPLAEMLPSGVKTPDAVVRPITLGDLASQTSGLPVLPDNMKPKDPGNPYADYTPAQLYKFLAGYKLTRAPGTYEYSNLGVGLLGGVLAKRAGQRYEQLLVDRIAKPLDMNDTRIKLTKNQKSRLALPYNAELKPDRNWDLPTLAGAGALRSTVDDMLKLAAIALADESDVPAEARPLVDDFHLALQKRYGKPGEIGVGLCWHLAGDGVTWWHNGQTGGYSSCIFLSPPLKIGVVVLTNTATMKTTELGGKILQALAGAKPAPIATRTPVKVDPAALEKYVGSYALSPAFAITVTLEDGQLVAQATGQQKLEIFAESPTEFFYRVVDAQISFVKGKDGQVEKMILHQNGHDLPGLKVDAKSGGPKGR